MISSTSINANNGKFPVTFSAHLNGYTALSGTEPQQSDPRDCVAESLSSYYQSVTAFIISPIIAVMQCLVEVP